MQKYNIRANVKNKKNKQLKKEKRRIKKDMEKHLKKKKLENINLENQLKIYVIEVIENKNKLSLAS